MQHIGLDGIEHQVNVAVAIADAKLIAEVIAPLLVQLRTGDEVGAGLGKDFGEGQTGRVIVGRRFEN